MSATLTFATPVTGATSIKPIMKFVFAIDAMPSFVGPAMKWISAMTAMKLFAAPAPPCCPASFVAVACVKIVPRLVEGQCYGIWNNMPVVDTDLE